MTVRDLVETNIFSVLNIADDSREITKVFCCDLLSVAMSKAPVGGCWITVMGNINTLAVASLTDCACVILAEGTLLDDSVIEKAKQQEITLLKTEMPIFEAGIEVYNMLSNIKS
ncbi:MAG: hypothetical protein K6E85_11615 [Lachnospiraceae bacterium]|nr:hypothetical protein [Lachnospiraceae bacterium]